MLFKHQTIQFSKNVTELYKHATFFQIELFKQFDGYMNRTNLRNFPTLASDSALLSSLDDGARLALLLAGAPPPLLMFPGAFYRATWSLSCRLSTTQVSIYCRQGSVKRGNSYRGKRRRSLIASHRTKDSAEHRMFILPRKGRQELE